MNEQQHFVQLENDRTPADGHVHEPVRRAYDSATRPTHLLSAFHALSYFSPYTTPWITSRLTGAVLCVTTFLVCNSCSVFFLAQRCLRSVRHIPYPPTASCKGHVCGGRATDTVCLFLTGTPPTLIAIRQPIVTGTSVLAIQFKDGIMMAADNLGAHSHFTIFRLSLSDLQQHRTDLLHASRTSDVFMQSERPPLSVPLATCPTSKPSRPSLTRS